MSEGKCEHNNHSHFLLYFGVWLLWMQSCCDCSGEQTRLKNQIRYQDSDISTLKSEVSSLKSENSRLSGQVASCKDATDSEHEQLNSLQRQVDRLPRK